MDRTYKSTRSARLRKPYRPRTGIESAHSPSAPKMQRINCTRCGRISPKPSAKSAHHCKLAYDENPAEWLRSRARRQNNSALLAWLISIRRRRSTASPNPRLSLVSIPSGGEPAATSNAPPAPATGPGFPPWCPAGIQCVNRSIIARQKDG